jgi:hypothetical protein
MIRLMTCAITELKKEYGRMPKKEETGCINRMLRLSYFVLMVDLYSQYLALTLTATSYLCVLGQKNTHVLSLFILLVAWLTSVKARRPPKLLSIMLGTYKIKYELILLGHSYSYQGLF